MLADVVGEAAQYVRNKLDARLLRIGDNRFGLGLAGLNLVAKLYMSRKQQRRMWSANSGSDGPGDPSCGDRVGIGHD